MDRCLLFESTQSVRPTNHGKTFLLDGLCLVKICLYALRVDSDEFNSFFRGNSRQQCKEQNLAYPHTSKRKPILTMAKRSLV